ncbi:hypothetical protein BCR34DRAFT_138211 [Clohesyomyces aquaticus]|uniref:Uncharacterized protein n=1 Tax=Clohesyomyces aquaticus TaxID=1231657 RepID=A0A1Y2A1F1_9PLEO|nr:hypothetical protein BCR34DRAFT_138211 [Clohesyomyces aquaticus]
MNRCSRGRCGSGSTRGIDRLNLLVGGLFLLLSDELVHELSDVLAEGTKAHLLGNLLSGSAAVLAGILVLGNVVFVDIRTVYDKGCWKKRGARGIDGRCV